MNAETQTHAKMEDSARTHREAFNAHANLDLREKNCETAGLSTIDETFTVDCRSCELLDQI